MLLIIAYGIPLRGDDGAGIVLGELLEHCCRRRCIATRQLVCQQLAPDLVPEMTRPEITRVVFTDTRVATADGNGLSVIAEALDMNNSGLVSGHHLSPETLLLIASKLHQREVKAWQITVPGISFGHGQSFSSVTCRAFSQAQPILESFLDEEFGKSGSKVVEPAA
jgi:Ni,Fe-hydrogenase maturation factor